MANCEWQRAFPDDYGSAHHLSIYCPTQPKLLADAPVPELGWLCYQPYPERRRRASYYRDGLPQYGHDEWLQGVWEAAGCAMHFSRGTAAALLYWRCAPRVNRIALAGFCKIHPGMRGEFARHHPEELDAAHPEHANRDTHDWAAEYAVLRTFAAMQEIELEWR